MEAMKKSKYVVTREMAENLLVKRGFNLGEGSVCAPSDIKRIAKKILNPIIGDYHRIVFDF